jgi:hypothetical protein
MVAGRLYHGLGPAAIYETRLAVNHTEERRKFMSDHGDSRVLVRIGARLLTDKELNSVSAARETTTKCSFNPSTGQHDGDIGEC